MQYECGSCKRVFLHPAKRTISDLLEKTYSSGFVETLITGGKEMQVCPYCGSLDLKEHGEPEITSVLSVDLADVDKYLKQGYLVHEIYSKAVILTKREVKNDATA